MTQTNPIVNAPRQTRGFFAVVGPDRKAVGERIDGAMICGPALREDDDFSTVFTAAADVTLRAPREAITDACEEAGRLGFFSERGALMWTARHRAEASGERLHLDGVRVLDGT